MSATLTIAEPNSLPALVDRAAATLSGARNSAEVLTVAAARTVCNRARAHEACLMTSPHNQYFVISAGISYERNEDDRTFAATLRDIIDGQFEINPCGDLSVIWVDFESGSCADVTKEAARAVLERLTDDRTNASWELRNWIETHCGALSAEHLAEAV